MEMVMELLHRRVLAVEGAARRSSRLWRRLEEALVLEGCKGIGGSIEAADGRSMRARGAMPGRSGVGVANEGDAY